MVVIVTVLHCNNPIRVEGDWQNREAESNYPVTMTVFVFIWLVYPNRFSSFFMDAAKAAIAHYQNVVT